MNNIKLNTNHKVQPSILPEEKDQTLEIKTSTIAIEVFCNVCRTPLQKPLSCGRCKSVSYCSQTCQKKDWNLHKPNCKEPLLSQFTSKREKIGNWYIPFYSLKTSYTSKNSLFDLSDLVGLMSPLVHDEFMKQMGKKIGPELQGKIVAVPAHNLMRFFVSALENRVEGNDAIDKKYLCLVPKLTAIYTQFFKENEDFFKIDTKDSDAFFISIHARLRESLWQSCIKDYPDYQIEEIHVLLKKNQPTKFLEMNCVQFAFSFIGEKNFNPVTDHNPSDLLKNLALWNYYPVVEPKSGDLVVYFNEKASHTPHVGVLTTSGKVCSLPGWAFSFAVTTPLTETSVFYGFGNSQIAFFRKKTTV